MNFIDDEDSSSFCSPHTHKSLSTSPPRGPQEAINLNLNLNLSKGNPDKEKKEEENNNKVNNSREESKSVICNGSHSIESSEVVKPNETSLKKKENKEGQLHTKESKENNNNNNNIKMDMVVNSVINATEAINIENNNNNDDDDMSSIKFELNDATSHGSKSPTPSSIQFVRDPSILTLRESSTSLQRNMDQILDSNTNKNEYNKNLFSREDKKENEIPSLKISDRPIGPWVSKYNEPDSSLPTRPASTTDLSENKIKHKQNYYVYNSPRNSLKSNKSRCSSNDKSELRKNNNNNKFQPGERDSLFQRESSGSRGTTTYHHNKRIEYKQNPSSVPSSARSSASSNNSFFTRRLQNNKKSQYREGIPQSPFRSAPYSILSPRNNNNNNGNNILKNQRVTPVRGRSGINSLFDINKENRMHGTVSPLRTYGKRKEEVLALIEEEMNYIREEVRMCDIEMENAMLRDPFERLYHMNNRRDRDERRSRILHYMRLEETKEKLLAEDDEAEAKRKAQRRESARRREELFDRLYNATPTRLHNTSNMHNKSGSNYNNNNNNNNSRRDSSRAGRNGENSYIADDALFTRLYNEALDTIAERRERAKQAAMEREKKELEELLQTRIIAKLELESPTRRPRTPQELQTRAASLQRKLIENPKELREFLATKRLSKKDEEQISWRLYRHGYVSAEKLAEKKQQKELEGCTFKPKTNNIFKRHSVASPRTYNKVTAAFTSKIQQQQQGESGSTTPVTSKSPQRSFSRTQNRACEQLYIKALRQKERRKLLVEEAEKQKKLLFLKSKLKEDHHFRRRVELDPSLAERYMNSLVV